MAVGTTQGGAFVKGGMGKWRQTDDTRVHKLTDPKPSKLNYGCLGTTDVFQNSNAYQSKKIRRIWRPSLQKLSK